MIYAGKASFEGPSQAQFLDILYLRPPRTFSLGRVLQMFEVSVTLADGDIEPYWEARNQPRDC